MKFTWKNLTCWTQRRVLILVDEGMFAVAIAPLMIVSASSVEGLVCGFSLYGIGAFCAVKAIIEKRKLKQAGQWRSLGVREMFSFPELWRKNF